MAYFIISSGLRGCYMPDSSYVIRANSRRELKAAIESEADMCGDECVGLSKRAIAEFTAWAWKHRTDKAWTFDHVLPYATQRNVNKAWGIFVSRATREDYLQQEETDA